MIQRNNLIRALKREARKAPLILAKPGATVEPQTGQHNATLILFLWEHSAAQAEEEALVQKMGEALKLFKNQWGMQSRKKLNETEWQKILKEHRPQICIWLGDENPAFGPAEGFRAKWNLYQNKELKCEVLKGPSVSSVLADATKKRELWKDLQSALLKLQRDELFS